MSEDRDKYVHIGWLMPSVDVKSVLERLGVRVDKQIGDEIWGWCPDHRMFVPRDPSHPKWSVNVRTGQTKCLTEDRGSNLVFIVSRIRHCALKDAVEWMLGGASLTDAEILGMQSDIVRLTATSNKEGKKTIKHLSDIAELLKTGSMTEEGYDFFMRPPGKKPTLIEKETVDHYGCVVCRNGYYANRVIVPCKMRSELVGFAAIDMFGEKEWARRHPTMDSKTKYRKVLFPSGMERGKILFGFDDCKFEEDILGIVEGAREVIKLRQFGYAAVGVQGSGISAAQILLLAEIRPKRIVILMDGDDAGYEAQRKIHDRLVEHFQNIIKGNTPRGHDPKTLPGERLVKIFDGSGFST